MLLIITKRARASSLYNFNGAGKETLTPGLILGKDAL